MHRAAAHPPLARLKTGAEIRRVLAHGDVFPGAQALVRRLANDRGRPRLGLSTPRRFGSSVVRNRFRRLVREAFRLNQAGLGTFDYLVSPRRGLLIPNLAGLVSDLLRTRTAAPAPRRDQPAAGRDP